MHVPAFATQSNPISSWPATLSLCLQGLYQKYFTQELQRYFWVSVMAFCIDVGVMLMMKEGCGFHYLNAAALGFCSGIVVAYVGSIRWAFHIRCGTDWRQEFVLFAAIGVGGLCLNEGIMWIATAGLDFAYPFSKFIAGGHVFLFNFLLRKWLLFSMDGVTNACTSQTIGNALSSLGQGQRV